VCKQHVGVQVSTLIQQVSVLIRGGADVNAADGGGFTALHWACLQNYPRIVQILIDAGADRKIATNMCRYLESLNICYPHLFQLIVEKLQED
jgi:ankyrin repeat protein